MRFVFLFACLTLCLSSVFGELVPCGALKKEERKSCADFNGFKNEGLIDVSQLDSDFEKMCCKSLCGDKKNKYNIEGQGFYIQRDEGSSEYKLRVYFNKNDDCKFINLKGLPESAISNSQDQSNSKGEYLERIDEDTFHKLYSKSF